MDAHMFIQLAVIFGIYLGGEGIASLLPIAIPGNIIGMLALFILLFLKWIKLRQIQTLGKFLLGNMAFFFIPAGVSIIESIETVKGDLLPILAICILTTFITFTVTAFTAKGITKLQERMRNR
ncbi:CidA/LrgA family protein [Niameybacter massiliensis]|uniref:CidA/LrgA family protein n=1 Tax=Holtiella tumoricola TaxID=3018743 RepID=A0AA42IZS8_9FIRM|nr:CidA/LrgA family protein [Holtiella tumoricola]MDA3730757.1 CidA/LrgA family protein [Holtiella tumoricola]